VLTDLLKDFRFQDVAGLPELALLVAYPSCDLKLLGLDRSLLSLAYVLDPRSASLLGREGLGTERVHFASELRWVDPEPV
jgi:hypothetical protein